MSNGKQRTVLPARVYNNKDDYRLLFSIKSDLSKAGFFAEGVSKEAIGEIEVDHAFFKFDSFSSNYKPSLCLYGHLKSLKCSIEGVDTKLVFAKDIAPYVDFNYEFTREELAELVQKGLYSPLFSVPNIIKNNIYEFPFLGGVNYTYAERENIPLIFVDIQEYGNKVDSKTSGYVLSNYFEETPDVTKVIEVTKEFTPKERSYLELDKPVIENVKDNEKTMEEEFGVTVEKEERTDDKNKTIEGTVENVQQLNEVEGTVAHNEERQDINDTADVIKDYKEFKKRERTTQSVQNLINDIDQSVEDDFEFEM